MIERSLDYFQLRISAKYKQSVIGTLVRLMTPGKIFVFMAAFSACLLIGIACGQVEGENVQSLRLDPRDALDDMITSVDQPVSGCSFSPFIRILAFYKDASQEDSLVVAEKSLKRNGFNILDPAANQNVHVMGCRSNPDAIATVVCTWLGQKPTSVVIHVISPDEFTAQKYSDQIWFDVNNFMPGNFPL